jgi:hypothetical protein
MSDASPYKNAGEQRIYEAGYNEGFDHPKQLFARPPAPYSPDAAELYKKGFKDGQAEAREHAGAPGPAESSATGGSDHQAGDGGPPAAGEAPAGPPAAHPSPPGEPAVGITPTAAAPETGPLESDVHGLPAFEVNWPVEAPLATAELDTGEALVKAELSLGGSTTVSFEDPVRAATLDAEGLKLEATRALGPLTEGLQVSGLPFEPRIGVTRGTEYVMTEERFAPPNTVELKGSARIEFTVDSRLAGPVRVSGEPEARLEVSVIPHGEPPERQPETTEEFHDTHQEVWAAVGAGALLVFVAVALAPETAGGSLALMPIAL